MIFVCEDDNFAYENKKYIIFHVLYRIRCLW